MLRSGIASWFLWGLLVGCGDGDGDKDGRRADADSEASSAETADTQIVPDILPTQEIVDSTATSEVSDDGDAEPVETREVATTDAETLEDENDTIGADDSDAAGDGADTETPEIEAIEEVEDIERDEGDTTVPEEIADDVPSEVAADIDDAAEEVDVGPADPCSTEPSSPLAFTTLTGFTGSEDFAFHREYAYSVNENGNLVRDKIDGAGQLVLSNLSGFAAGMVMLPDGRLAVNDAESGSLVLVTVSPPPGQQVTKQVVLGGLSYPNGIDVDNDGFLYIAEQDAGRVRRVNPDTGEFEVIATELYNPNGVSFAPGYDRIYVGSFGGGIVYNIDRKDDGTWGNASVYLALPGFGRPPETIDSCKGSAIGDWCYTSTGLGGQCDDTLGTGKLQCVADPEGKDPLSEICAGLDANQSCSIKIGGQVFSGDCAPTGFNGLYCQITQNLSQPCFHASPGKPCVSFQFGAPFFGTCTLAEDIPPEWGYPDEGLFCVQPGQSDGGGLDGLNVDACGTVYVTEYILGRVWRKVRGREPEVVVELPSQWIPNMHWGNGLGGWDTESLYVADRDQGRMFAIKVGREGKHTVTPP